MANNIFYYCHILLIALLQALKLKCSLLKNRFGVSIIKLVIKQHNLTQMNKTWINNSVYVY